MRPRRWLLPILLLAALVFIGAGMTGPVAAIDDDSLVAECAIEPGEDFAPPPEGNETIGWFDGYWYNESLDVELEGNLSPEELDHLSARSAARVEALRCLSFEEMPPIEIVDREEFAEDQGAFFEAVGEPTREFDNQQFETLLTIGSDVDSIEVRREGREVTAGGYYDFEQDRIVVIANDPEALTIDEAVLAHELGHALQDQHFNLSRYERDTTDRDKAVLGVIEGSARRLELAYQDRCDAGEWGEPCMTASGGGGGEPPPNWAQYFISFQPYSDGPNFVDVAYERGGWTAVNELFEDVPRATLHTIEPSTYGEVEPMTVTVPDMSEDGWERLQIPEGPDHNVIGRAGMSAILMGQSAEAPGGERILAPTDFQNLDESGLAVDPFNPFNYDLDQTEGWRGDRLYVYTNGENETGSVWRSTWASEEDAADFLEAYEALARYRDGEPVEGIEHTWRFSEASEFDMVVNLELQGASLRIVTAPTVETLPEVHRGVDVQTETEPPTPPTPPVDDDSGDDGEPPNEPDPTPGDDDEDNATPAEDSDDVIPGFGVLAAVLALWWIAVRRR